MSEVFQSIIPKKPENRCVVRLLTSCWNDKRGVHQRKSLNYLRRKSVGHSMLEEDCNSVGADDVIPTILNLDECKDGIYEVVMVNVSTDIETGCLDDWDYRLVPFEEASSQEEA